MSKAKHAKIAVLIGLVACCFSFNIFAATSQTIITKIEFTPENYLEISLSNKTDTKVFILENPPRLVVDIKNSKVEKPKNTLVLPSYIKSFRYSKNQDSLRFVFDLSQKITIKKSLFQKIKNQEVGKIVIKFGGIKNSTQPKEATLGNFSEEISEGYEVRTEKIINPDGSAKYIVRKIPKNSSLNITSNKIPIIVVDAGHGGKDPGTIGTFARTKEKNLTLSYAKELVKQLNNTKRFKAYLTRNNDFFVPLRKRVEKARNIRADLFISLHANSISDHEISGFSIYTLSEKSSDKQAELLAQKENRADIINGVNFAGASQEIMKTLIDLSQRESKNSSALFANIVIKSVKSSEITILQNSHRFAGFAVLTAPDMSSVLVELGYLSNKEEEKRLNSITYKRKIAENLVEAINRYFSQNKS